MQVRSAIERSMAWDRRDSRGSPAKRGHTAAREFRQDARRLSNPSQIVCRDTITNQRIMTRRFV